MVLTQGVSSGVLGLGLSQRALYQPKAIAFALINAVVIAIYTHSVVGYDPRTRGDGGSVARNLGAVCRLAGHLVPQGAFLMAPWDRHSRDPLGSDGTTHGLT